MFVQHRPSGTPCKKALHHIQTELDSYLNQAVYRQMKKHLQRCQNCKFYLDSLKKVVYLYQRLPSMHPTDRVRKKLLKTLQLEIKHRRIRNH